MHCPSVFHLAFARDRLQRLADALASQGACVRPGVVPGRAVPYAVCGWSGAQTVMSVLRRTSVFLLQFYICGARGSRFSYNETITKRVMQLHAKQLQWCRAVAYYEAITKWPLLSQWPLVIFAGPGDEGTRLEVRTCCSGGTRFSGPSSAALSGTGPPVPRPAGRTRTRRSSLSRSRERSVALPGAGEPAASATEAVAG